MACVFTDRATTGRLSTNLFFARSVTLNASKKGGIK